MITIKKNAIKYKSSDGTMKDSGVLCQVGTFGVDYARYAKVVQFTEDILPPAINLQLDGVETIQSLFTGNAGKSLQEITITCKNPVTSMYRMIYCTSSHCPNLKKIIFHVDTSQCINFTNAFSYLRCMDENGKGCVEIIGELDFTSATAMGAPFQTADGLKEVRFARGTLRLSLTMAQSKDLSDASIDSIVNGFADMTGQTAIVFTVHKDVKARIEANPVWLATLTSKNVTLA